MMLETGRLMLRPRDEGDAGVLCRCASDLEAGPVAGRPVHTSAEDG